MLKKSSFIFASLCLSLSILSSPIHAAATPTTSPVQSPSSPQNSSCKPCERPFKRLVKAMHTLKKTNEMTEDEFKNAYLWLIKVPKENFTEVSDPDQKAADLLYKSKMITDVQYKKISKSLSNMPLSS